VDVFLLRTALTEGDLSAPEANRFLSAEGRQIVRALGNRLRLSDQPRFTRFFTRPLARLSQTDCQIAHSDPFFTRDGESTS